jgi:hypothetical protein
MYEYELAGFSHTRYHGIDFCRYNAVGFIME